MAQPVQGNPFAAPPAAAPAPAMNPQQQQVPPQQQPVQSGNPFDPFSAQAAVEQSTPFTSAVGGSSPQDTSAAQAPFNQFAAPPQQSQQPVQQQQEFAPQVPQVQSHEQPQPVAQQPQVVPQQIPPQAQQQVPQQVPQQQQQAPPQFQSEPQQQQQQPPQQHQQQQGYPQQAEQPQNPFASALVPSQQPSNPYAGYVAPQQQHQQQPQPANPFGALAAIVPATQQQSQWAVPGVAAAASASFDPFAPPPPPAPAPAPPPAPVPVPTTQLVPSTEPQAYPDAPVAPVQEPIPFDEQKEPPQQQHDRGPASTSSVGPPITEVNAVNSGYSVVSEPETTLTHRSHDREMVPHDPNNQDVVPYHREPTKPSPEQNKFSRVLAQNAGPNAAPLPKGEMVVKSGYILSRISFRTILMKKWKQTYWVQYGRHTMLWFRSENHFNEWLSNPYLTQSQRNFLVKLAVNFVHDLYKPNVRGYQVTQSHTKPYGRKLLRQFKLERWMDYGPTIAAAFGSQDEKEVDELRQTIIECMRNTPLDGGLRATGAVRQSSHEEQQRQQQYHQYDDHRRRSVSEDHVGNGQYHTYGRAQSERPAGDAMATSAAAAGVRSVASAADLLDDQNVYAGGGVNQSYDEPRSAYYSQGPPPQQQQMPPQQQQYGGYR